MTSRKRLIDSQTRNALLLALGAGFGAIQVQSHDSPALRLVVAFLAAALPVLALHWSHTRKARAAPAEPPK